MNKSDTISSIAAALAKAQSQIDDATKDSTNPHFKSKYADLASVRDAIRIPLANNDLAIVQGPRRADGGVEVETMIVHKSGEWISESVFIPVNKWDAHGMGSGISYARRYGLMAMLCIATGDDDDGNAAVERGAPPSPAKKAPLISAPKQVEIRSNLKDAAKNGTEPLREYYRGLTSEERQAITDDFLKELKDQASAVDARKGAE